MLAAHLVPGYFAIVKSQPHWKPEWNRAQRAVLVAVAFLSTVAPDWDVIYNGLFRGFFNHSVLWTHSLLLHLSIGLIWLLLRRTGRWPYLQMLFALAAIGGLSHLLLDTYAHGTVLLYPFSEQMFVAPFAVRSLYGGVRAYVTDPIFLAEPVLFALALAHWITQRNLPPRVVRLALFGTLSGLAGFIVLFFAFLSDLQNVLA